MERFHRQHISPSMAQLQDLKREARAVPRMLGSFICTECLKRGSPDLSILVRTQRQDDQFCGFECFDTWRLTHTVMEVQDAAE